MINFRINLLVMLLLFVFAGGMEAKDELSTLLVSNKQGRFAEGLEQGILRCGEKLKTYFPYQSDDVNEIPDEISYENN